jgi:preprotein translocase subunit SecA
MVTIATNMAGRGTDILLGGNPEFMAKQECVKKGIAQPIAPRRARFKPSRRSNRTVWYYAGNEYAVPTDQWNEIFARYKANTDKEHDDVIEAGGCTSLAPSATKRAASTISFADAPDARATPGRRASIFRSKTT